MLFWKGGEGGGGGGEGAAFFQKQTELEYCNMTRSIVLVSPHIFVHSA